MDLEFRPAGEGGLMVYVSAGSAEEGARRVRGLLAALDQAPIPGVTDLVPARRSLLVRYDPLAAAPEELRVRLSHLSLSEGAGEDEVGIVEVPVVYGGRAGADLPHVAEAAGLGEREAAELHCSVEYTVLFLGFMPGFPYLGPLPERLRIPRMATPRTGVPAGSVAVAEDQTGIYPVASPGGWRIIGRTPLRLFDARQDPPALLRPGDRVRFVPIDEAAYSRIHFETRPGGR